MPIYICPISHSAPLLPVLTNEGITYDFESIALSLLRENTNNINSVLDPFTNGAIDTLIYNRSTKELNDALMGEEKAKAKELTLSHEIKTEIASLYTQLIARYPALKIYGIHTLEGMQALIGAPIPVVQMVPQPAVIVESLWNAAFDGHLPAVMAALTEGADINQVNANGATPLLVAAQNGHLPTVIALLTAGADFNQANIDGTTPLFIAAKKGHFPIVAALLAADPRMRQNQAIIIDGTTQLYIAILFGHLKVTKALLSHQMATTPDNPLYTAAQNGYGYQALVRTLLSDATIRDYYLNQIIKNPDFMRNSLRQNADFFTELAKHRNELWARLCGPQHFNLPPDEHEALLSAILNSRQVPDEALHHPLYTLFSAPLAPQPKNLFSWFSRPTNITLDNIQAYTNATYPATHAAP